MPPVNNLSINPTSQSITWTRNTPFPALSLFGVTASEFAFVTANINYQNTSTEWLDLSGDYDPEFQMVLFSDGSSAQILPVLKNINLLTGNSYTAKINLTRGTLTRTHTVNLTIVGDYSPIKTEKDNYNVVYNRITNALTGDFSVNILNNTVPENVTLETSGTLFLEKTFTTNFTLEEDPAFPFSSNTELPTTGTKVMNCRLKNEAGNVLYVFTVTILVVNTNDITIAPENLSFSLYRHLNEQKSAFLQISNPANLPFTIEAPDFVTLSFYSGNSTMEVNVATVNSGSLLAQTYTGDIVFTYNSKTVKVPVTLKNIDFIDLQIGDYNFCLDGFVMTIQRINDTAKFVRITLEIEIESAERTVNANPSYQIAYFNGSASTDIGKKVHNYFPLFSKPIFDNPGIEFNNVFIYKPAKVKITIEELDSNYEIVFSKSIKDIKLFPGKKPKMFPSFTNAVLKRIYSDTSHLFSYLTTMVEPSDIVGKTVSNNPYQPDEVNAVYFEDYEGLMTFGNYKNVLGTDFVMMPKGHQQIYFQYLNENLVPELFVFNGDYLIDDNYEHTYDDIEFNAKKYDSKTISKLTLNTGFNFAEESEALSNLNKRVMSFVKIEDQVYKVFPVTSKFRRIDSSKNVNNNEFEFLIVNTDGN